MTAFSFAVLGDAPYRKRRDDKRFAGLIQDIKRQEPEFLAHLGDLKRGASPCKTKRYKEVRKLLAGFDGPLVYTPGDNDWADCFKKKSGDFDPQERLRKIRTLFYDDFAASADRKLGITRQPGFVENARWSIKDVVFLSLHSVGANNNLNRDPAEYRKRNRANLMWLKAAFERAHAGDTSALVLLTHANLWHPKRGKLQKGFRDCLALLAEEAQGFGRPILVAHGDKHRFIVDHPLSAAGPDARKISNVTRLQVMGDDELGAVMVAVDPTAKEPFRFRVLEPPN